VAVLLAVPVVVPVVEGALAEGELAGAVEAPQVEGLAEAAPRHVSKLH
jgi:hypothetical protein